MSAKISNILILLFFFLLGWFAGASWGPPKKVPPADSSLIQEAKRIVENHFYKRVNLEGPEFQNAMLAGLVSGLKDPYSYILPPMEAKYFSETMEGEIGGVGISVEFTPKGMSIAQVLPGTPAEKAGLQPYDLIIKIEKTPVHEFSEIEAVQKIRGKPGTKIALTIWREGWTAPKEIVLTRARIEVPSVWDIKMVTQDIGYFRILEFNKNTPEQVKQAIEQLKKKGAKAFIIDLRNNPGGLFDAGVEVADLFLPSGVIVQVRTRQKKEIWEAKKGDAGEGFPLAILQNKNTASASELFIGALKDYGIATTLGENSRGKAAMQSMIPLSNGSFLYLTTGHYFTPKGRDIHGKGIAPDIPLPETTNSFLPPEAQKIQDEIAKMEEQMTSLQIQLRRKMNEVLLQKAITLLHQKEGLPPKKPRN
ncbi:MAG: S41 family peptidase [bacterium JZ-2024 1]